MKRILFSAVALSAAVAAGWLGRGALPATARPASPEGKLAPPGSPPSLRCDGISIEQMRALLAERLGTPHASAAEPSPPSPEAKPASPASLEQVATVETAMNDGVWSPEDRDLLRRNLGGLSGEQADALLASLAAAVNAGRLKLDSPLL